MRPYDVKPVFDQFNQIIRKFKVTGTPTVLIRYSETEVCEYSGRKEIREGLAMLKERLGIVAAR